MCQTGPQCDERDGNRDSSCSHYQNLKKPLTNKLFRHIPAAAGIHLSSVLHPIQRLMRKEESPTRNTEGKKKEKIQTDGAPLPVALKNPHHPHRQQIDSRKRRPPPHRTVPEPPFSSLTRLPSSAVAGGEASVINRPTLLLLSPLSPHALFCSVSGCARGTGRRLRRSFRLCSLSVSVSVPVASVVPLSDGDRALILAPAGLRLRRLRWGSVRPGSWWN